MSVSRFPSPSIGGTGRFRRHSIGINNKCNGVRAIAIYKGRRGVDHLALTREVMVRYNVCRGLGLDRVTGGVKGSPRDVSGRVQTGQAVTPKRQCFKGSYRFTKRYGAGKLYKGRKYSGQYMSYHRCSYERLYAECGGTPYVAVSGPPCIYGIYKQGEGYGTSQTCCVTRRTSTVTGQQCSGSQDGVRAHNRSLRGLSRLISPLVLGKRPLARV